MSDITPSVNASPIEPAEALMTHLLDLAKTIKNNILQRPLEKFRELNLLITQHWHSLLWPYLQSQPLKKTAFYTTVYKQVLEVLLKYDKIIDQSEVNLFLFSYSLVPFGHPLVLPQHPRSFVCSRLHRRGPS